MGIAVVAEKGGRMSRVVLSEGGVQEIKGAAEQGQQGPTASGRRAFLQQGTLILAAAGVAWESAWGADPSEKRGLRVGLVTDMHHADKAPAGTRHYRETRQKLAEAGAEFQKQQIDLLVELGDLIDAADSVAVEQAYLRTIQQEFSSLCPDRHYVLGNHCVDTLTKQEFLAGVEQADSYYSFDRGGYHFVVLDSCFRSDGTPYGRRNFTWTDPNIPPKQVEWLKGDLQKTKLPVIVLAHQRLDVENNYGVKNSPEIRQIFEQQGNVLAVFQGHSHKNDLKEIGGIHYCTLVAMVEGSGPENNGYSILELDPQGTLKLTGFRQQQTRTWQ